MARKSNMLTIGAFGIGLAVFAIISSVGMAAASPNISNSLTYEFDNGTSWTLQKNTAAIKTSLPVGTTYADAGVVLDMGSLAGLSASPGSSPFTLSGSSGLADNIWISNGPSEANTPGTHPLTNPIDFAYGFDNHDGTFYMTSGTLEGQTVSLATLQSTYPNAEAYVWAGYVFDGSNYTGKGDSAIHINAVNGMNLGNRMISFLPNSDGSTDVSVH
jgi:hypothetical protein